MVSGTPMALALALATCLVVIPGCDGKSKENGPFPGPILARLKGAKLPVGEFQKVDKPERYGAQECQEGIVGELAVLLCQYETAEGAAKAENKRLSFVGKAVTGAERVDGRVALVVSDRDRKDLKGARIQAILKAFKDVPPF